MKKIKHIENAMEAVNQLLEDLENIKTSLYALKIEEMFSESVRKISEDINKKTSNKADL